MSNVGNSARNPPRTASGLRVSKVFDMRVSVVFDLRVCVVFDSRIFAVFDPRVSAVFDLRWGSKKTSVLIVFQN